MNKKIVIFMVACILVLIGFWGCGSTGESGGISYDSADLNNEPSEVSLKTVDGINLRRIVVFADGTSNAEKERALMSQNCKIIKHLNLINASVVMLPENLPSQALERIKVLAEVKRIDEDVIVNATAKPPASQPAQVIPWGVTQIKANQAWNAVSPPDYGYGVKVGVLDTGIDYTHPDLKLNVKGGVNTINSFKDYSDDNGHGTHVAGIIAGINNEIGIVGVGPQIYLYGVKVLNRNGSGYLSDIIEGLDWSINNKMQVINMSLGTTSNIISFQEAIIRTYQSGITIVASAGNDYGGAVNYPAEYSETIAVTASDQNNRIASFSSVGPEVDLIAPGVSINSTYKGGGYKVLSGTSMSCPHVTGSAALKLYAKPGMSPDEVRNCLMSTADNIGLLPEQMGAGLVNAYNLVLMQ